VGWAAFFLVELLASTSRNSVLRRCATGTMKEAILSSFGGERISQSQVQVRWRAHKRLVND
jgi:hypothetical protein